jgi:hypothetical protein
MDKQDRLRALFSKSIYRLSGPSVVIAKAKNICQICRRDIKKGEKYILCKGWDQHRGRVVQGFSVTVKSCRECSTEFLKLKSWRNLTLSPNHVILFMEVIKQLVFFRNRFNILKEKDPFVEFLEQQGLAGILK